MPNRKVLSMKDNHLSVRVCPIITLPPIPTKKLAYIRLVKTYYIELLYMRII